MIPLAILWPLIGAAVGGGAAKAKGGDWKKGALLGAAAGLTGGAASGALGGLGAGAGAAGGAAAEDAAILGATGGLDTAAAGAASSAAPAAGITAAQSASAPVGWQGLLANSGKTAATNAATGAAMEAISPHQQMQQFEDVPPLPQMDLQSFMQEMMKQSTTRR